MAQLLHLQVMFLSMFKGHGHKQATGLAFLGEMLCWPSQLALDNHLPFFSGTIG